MRTLSPNTSLEPTAWMFFESRFGIVVRQAMSSRGSAINEWRKNPAKTAADAELN